MRHLRLLTAFLLLSSVALAQTRPLSGIIKDSKSGSGIPSVTVKVVGRNIQTITNGEGVFSLNVPTGNVTLEFSSIGYAPATSSVAAGDNSIALSLEPSTTNLSEVVVTALGISKESRKVGYSVTTVNAEDLNKARETNIGNSLSGRVAGLKVTGTSSGPGGTAKILLRGLPSMNSGGAPLFVINGVPMDNTQRGSSGEWGGADNGDGIGNLNPDDIESMTVLKGQSASALYGARASNGVILVTTKTGKKGNYSVEYNANVMADKAMNNTDFQYEYG
ncbi:MAG: TonB-dependent receptor plug domain-containing protein, partial [Flavitalea sp.]